MDNHFGILTVNGKELQVLEADCSLFVGRLSIDTTTSDGDLAISNIPFPLAFKIEDLSGMSFSSSDCTKDMYENSVFQTSVSFRNDYFAIRSINIDSLTCKNGVLKIAIRLRASGTESDAELSINGQIRAEEYPIDAQRLLYGCLEPIPIRFADHYLPLLGLPKLPVGSTLADVIKIFGQPNHQGGGVHAKFGQIPHWIRYTLPNCYLRLQLENEVITQITIMSLDTPPCDISKSVL